MRVPVIIKPDRRDKKRVNYYVGNLSIYTTGKETVINVVPMYNADGKRGKVFRFITIPQDIKKDDIKAFLFNDMGCSVIKTTIADVYEIELTYYTSIDKIVVKFKNIPTGEKHRLSMYRENCKCIISKDNIHYKYDTNKAEWVKIL